jgi:hypothetical protein
MSESKPIKRFTRIVVGIISLCAGVSAGLAATPAPRKLLVASNTAYSTVVLATTVSASTAPVHFHSTDCKLGPGDGVTLDVPPAGGSGVGKVGTVCGDSSGFALLDIPTSTLANLSSLTSLVRFDTVTQHDSFTTSMLGALDADHPNVTSPVLNSDGFGTFITLFPSIAVGITVTAYDGAHTLLGTETFTAYPPFTQYRIHTPFPVGSVSVTLGDPVWHCFPSDCHSIPVYGLVTTGSVFGGSTHAFPFGGD